MKSFEDRVCVVTGAASGIGKALVKKLYDSGAKVAVNDINVVGLEQLKSELGASDDRFWSMPVDTSKQDQVLAFRDAAMAHYGTVHLVINNAGIALGAVAIQDIDDDDFRKIMDVNFWGMVYGTKAFLPELMKHNGEAAIVNVSSLFGLLGISYQGPYCSSKFAIKGYTESLRMEMLHQKNQLLVSTVHPGGVKTAIARNSILPKGKENKSQVDQTDDFEKYFITTPESAANTILAGIKKRKNRIVVGRDAIFMDRLNRLLPRSYSRIFVKYFGAAIKI